MHLENIDSVLDIIEQKTHDLDDLALRNGRVSTVTGGRRRHPVDHLSQLINIHVPQPPVCVIFGLFPLL